MSYINPDNLKVIQQHLETAGPRGHIDADDAGKFAKVLDAGYLILDSPDEMVKPASALDIGAPTQVSLLSAKRLNEPEGSVNVTFKTAEQIREGLLGWRSDLNKDDRHIPQLVIGNEVLGSVISIPSARRSQPVRVLGEVEGGGLGNRPIPVLPEIVLVKESKPVMANVQVMGRLLPRTNPLFKFQVDEGQYAKFEDWLAGVRRIRGLLRSKTKKGPKRKYHK